ncbi:MAG TPA: alpha/beta hydrolase [Candidatus Binataceae bacterium]|jgi:acetyl esterase|nr:alpha/beta hydrolase [Candidatus Binataceae bacterium]
MAFTMDPQIKLVLDQIAGLTGGPPRTMPVADARKGLDQVVDLLRSGGVEEVARAENRKIPGPAGEIPLRVFVPKSGSPCGALVYLHGGGWVLGGLHSHDNICRAFANAAGCLVVAVDYRLAPENKFPAAPEDCYAATAWVAGNAAALGYPEGRVAVGGDSAGGNLTAVVSMMARDRKGPKLRFQLLIYPATDVAMDTPSYRDFQDDGYFLSGADMIWFWNHYLARKEDGDNPYASPARAKDLSGLPPAFVITAGLDPLRDEGEAYARRLIEAGVPTLCARYEYVTHAVFNMAPLVDAGKTITRQAAAAVREALMK